MNINIKHFFASYELSENLNKQLNDMVFQLNDIIGKVNALNDGSNSAPSSAIIDDHNNNNNGGGGGGGSEASAVDEIVKILNTHLDSLQWIEKCSNDLKEKVSHLSSQTSAFKKDQSRLSFHHHNWSVLWMKVNKVGLGLATWKLESEWKQNTTRTQLTFSFLSLFSLYSKDITHTFYSFI